MPKFIIISSITGLAGYLTTAVALLLANAWWSYLAGVLMVAFIVGFGVFMARLAAESRHRYHVDAFKRRMMSRFPALPGPETPRA